MRTLLLAPPKILFQNSAQDWRDATGGNAVLFTDVSEKDAVLAHVGHVFAAIEFFKNFNGNGLVEHRAAELHASTPFEAIVPLAEGDVLRAARLREAFRLNGLQPTEARLFRNKYEMKLRARQRGVKVANFALTEDSIDVLQFVADNGYPVVVKPVDGRGSSGVQVIVDDEQLHSYLGSPAFAHRESPLIESFVPGDMYQANGLYLNGQCVLMTSVKCINSNLQFLNGEYLGLAMLDESDPLRERIFGFARDLLERVLPMPRDGLFHIEIFHTPSDELFLCEAACRLAGCAANDQIQAAFGVDVRMEFVKSQCLDDYAWRGPCDGMQPKKLVAELNIPPVSGVLKSLPDQADFEWIEFQKLTGIRGKRYDKMSFTNGEIASYLISGRSAADLAARVHKTANWFASESVWEQ